MRYNFHKEKSIHMGELLTQLRKANMQAMKDHDALKKGVLSLLVSSLALAEKEKGAPLSKEEEYALVQKELKQEKESLAMTPQDRTDLREEHTKKIAYLESWLPEQMSEEKIRAALEAILQEEGLEPVKKSQGAVMKAFMAKYRGQADGRAVNQVLSTLLK
jgi:uncharacterized protein YqeY